MEQDNQEQLYNPKSESSILEQKRSDTAYQFGSLANKKGITATIRQGEDENWMVYIFQQDRSPETSILPNPLIIPDKDSKMTAEEILKYIEVNYPEYFL